MRVNISLTAYTPTIAAEAGAMVDLEILLNIFERVWMSVDCFNCAAREVATTSANRNRPKRRS